MRSQSRGQLNAKSLPAGGAVSPTDSTPPAPVRSQDSSSIRHSCSSSQAQLLLPRPWCACQQQQLHCSSKKRPAALLQQQCLLTRGVHLQQQRLQGGVLGLQRRHLARELRSALLLPAQGRQVRAAGEGNAKQVEWAGRECGQAGSQAGAGIVPSSAACRPSALQDEAGQAAEVCVGKVFRDWRFPV